MFKGGTGETVNSTHILELALMKLSERVKWVPNECLCWMKKYYLRS